MNRNLSLRGYFIFLPVVLACLSLSGSPVFGAESSVKYAKSIVLGVPVHVVSIDMNDRDVQVYPMLAENGVGHSEPWSRMIDRARPVAAITGTFFDTRSLQPIGDIMIDGNMACWGTLVTAVCIGWNNEIIFKHIKRGSKRDWSEFRHVVVVGPTLLWGGQIALYPRAQGFTDGQLFVPKKRTAIGVTADNKLLLVVVSRPIYLKRLAKIMSLLGAVDAAALDGGSSCALYYRGKTLIKPGRRMTNLLVVYS